MKPLISEEQDSNTLRELGRASIQIVHDLKNQLNGLKLYATFLRKRMEKGDRPADEIETVGKLIAGLERAAADMTTLVRYGRPVELRRQPAVSIRDLIRDALPQDEGAQPAHLNPGGEDLKGEFDVTALSEALKAVTAGALKLRPVQAKEPLEVSLRNEAESEGQSQALIEWRGLQIGEGQDPFRSFAGSDGLRMALASKIIEAHGGSTEAEGDHLLVRLPVKNSDK